MEHPAPWPGSGLDSGDAVAGDAPRPSVGAESTGECKPGGGAENQLTGDGCGRSAGLCNAEVLGAAAGECEAHAARVGLQTGPREHGAASARKRRNTRCASGRACCAPATVARERDRYAVASSGTEGSGWGGGELRSAVRDGGLTSGLDG